MPDATKRSILLIDDDTSLLVTLSDFLRFENYEVATAESGEEGLKALRKMEPDLIILDMSMPGMGGIGFLKAISDAQGEPKYPVLVLTARANMAEFFANVDVDGFIAKPCEPTDLLMEVGRIIFLRSGAEDRQPRKSADKKRVLIGEDDEVKRQELTRAFAEEGFVVDSAGKGPEVIERAIVSRPDLVVLKLVMVNMNGDEVARMLLEMNSTSDLPVVLYDDTDSGMKANKIEGAKNVQAFIRGSDAQELTSTAMEVLSNA